MVDMLDVKKIPGGLSWNGEDRKYTFSHFKTGFEVISPWYISIELDENIICFMSRDVTIDGKGPFLDVEELLTEIYGELS